MSAVIVEQENATTAAAIARAEAAEKERDEARLLVVDLRRESMLLRDYVGGGSPREIEQWLGDERERRGVVRDDPWQERDAAVARVEAAEREIERLREELRFATLEDRMIDAPMPPMTHEQIADEAENYALFQAWQAECERRSPENFAKRSGPASRMTARRRSVLRRARPLS